MGQIELTVSRVRAAVFPFFDLVEIVFVAFVLSLEGVLIFGFGIQNGWAILLGSYVGIMGAGWLALPSRLDLEPWQIGEVRTILGQKLVEDRPNHFVPRLPVGLRWPRNFIDLRTNGKLYITGPRILLDGVRNHLEGLAKQR